MSKLNKTEARLMTYLVNGRSYSAERVCGYHSKFAIKARTTGVREFNAAESLIAKGLVQKVSFSSFMVTHGRGNSCHVCELVIKAAS